MGKQQTKFRQLNFGILGMLVVFLCCVLSFGICLLDIDSTKGNSKIYVDSKADTNSDINWIDIRSNSFSSNVGNVYYINSPAQLAYMNYVLTDCANSDSAVDYSGAIFVLENDIKLDNVYVKGYDKNVTPLWTPIEIGTKGKNRNITFNGNGHSIIGMNIKYSDTTPRKLGFFAEMVGGVFENVTFEDPIITYEYKGTSYASNDELRPDAPIELCVGVIAGSADSTYINEVKIENPCVTVATENSNGHNFCVGGAVGKLSFTSNLITDENGESVVKSTNTVTPTQWGLNTVDVYKNDSDSSGVVLKVESGNEDGVTYGEATNAYLGGLVGVNISSRIINSTLRDLSVDAQLDPKDNPTLPGTYYLGGLAGLTTQITTSEDLIVAAGFYNNLLIDVKLSDIIATAGEYYCGNLVGRVYSGGWIYNNIVIGTMPYSDFWGQVYNSLIFPVTDSMCIANLLGGVDEYYLSSNNDKYANCSCWDDLNNSEKFKYCPNHSADVSLDRDVDNNYDDSGSLSKMKKYNFYFESLESSEYKNFCTERVSISNGESEDLELTTFDLLNYFNKDVGYLYHAVSPILKYEVGLTINKISSDTNKDATVDEMRLDAVYRFRTWKINFGDKNEPYLGPYVGLDHFVTFVANSPVNSKAYWIINNNGREEKITELSTGRTYQIIYEPEKPQCEGYEFIAWKVEGLQEGTDEWISYKDRGLLDEDGYYIFGREHILETRRFIAVWQIKEYKVNFVVREKGRADVVFANYPEETVVFGRAVTGPTTLPVSDQGYLCVGWFLEENLPVDNEDADADKQWVFGSSSGNLMPGHDITLYSGWINNFTILSKLLNDTTYQSYYENYKNYFNDELGQNFYNAYQRALDARASGDNSNINELLTNLENAYKALQVDPQKLLALPAFDNTRMENTCPFLYNYEIRMLYNTFKNTAMQYIESDETDLSDVDAFIKYYNKLTDLFNALSENLNKSVAEEEDGVDSSKVQEVIKRYHNLQSQNEQLDKAKYAGDSLVVLDDARKKVEDLWTSEASDPDLQDLKLAIDAYENAIKNLKPAGTASSDKVEEDDANVNSAPQLPMHPAVLAVLIVLLLLACAGGYIGVDIFLSKRRVSPGIKAGKSDTLSRAQNVVNNEVDADDEDDYV